MISMKSKEITLTVALCLLSLLLGAANAELNIVSKSKWNGKPASGVLTKLELPVGRVIILHTASEDCNTENVCAQRVRTIQHYQMTVAKFDDIGYNFLIGNDGNVYEGRGWDDQGAFARGFNAGSLGITFIGTYEVAKPTDAALQAAQSLIESGVQLGKIKEDYKLFGHRQLAVTASPGDALHEIITKWPHWSSNV